MGRFAAAKQASTNASILLPRSAYQPQTLRFAKIDRATGYSGRLAKEAPRFSLRDRWRDARFVLWRRRRPGIRRRGPSLRRTPQPRHADRSRQAGHLVSRRPREAEARRRAEGDAESSAHDLGAHLRIDAANALHARRREVVPCIHGSSRSRRAPGCRRCATRMRRRCGSCSAPRRSSCSWPVRTSPT
jgi:hypothetical protein